MVLCLSACVIKCCCNVKGIERKVVTHITVIHNGLFSLWNHVEWVVVLLSLCETGAFLRTPRGLVWSGMVYISWCLVWYGMIPYQSIRYSMVYDMVWYVMLCYDMV